MSKHRWFRALVVMIAGMFFSGGAAAQPVLPAAPDTSILRIEISGRGGTTNGTAFLVHQAQHEDHVVYYFLTAGHLLDPFPLGEARAASLRVRLMVDESTTIETSGSRVVHPGGVSLGLDLAVVEAISTTTHLTPIAITMDPPSPGEVFLVKGRQASGLTVLTERVRFRSSRLVLGDRTAPDVGGLMGAPAMIDGAAFGLISECSNTRVPVITLLSAAFRFLFEAIPGWTPSAVPEE